MKLALVNRQKIIPASRAAPFQCHASTLVCLPCGTLVAAWFAGLREGSEDTAIWLSRYEHNIWTKPQRVAACEGEAHWNPVLFSPSDRLWLFYKVGSDVHVWKTWFITSSDRGFTWSTPTELVKGDILPRGPAKNKLLLASNGAWIAPGSIENAEHWEAFVDRSCDEGKHWDISFVPLEPHNMISGKNVALWEGIKKGMLWECCLENLLRWDGVIQPTLWESSPGHIHMLLRSTRGGSFPE
ncbi:putative cytoplasmic protein [Salmonella enterica subsp. arizonae]|uniref:Putative cytoplasmic protein n=1 Tax=Salmonella enterica subsp. arizonae TaxID=59203 RepID=A0A379S623_SALER|nr:putative cytoplasmic protein [Salmonella enterica subsp. arizonae]